MQFFTIPLVNQYPYYKFKSVISGVTYTLYIRYNSRSNRFMMDILDPAENEILAGVVLLIERNLTGQYTTLTVPPGTFFCTDDSNQEQQPTIYSFGIDHTLWYADPTV